MNILILAGERPGGDPLAIAEGVANKTEIMIAGQSMLAHVLATLRQWQPAADVSISGSLRQAPPGVQVIATAATPCMSVLRALEQVAFPVLITTADHPLLTPAILAQFLQKASTLPGDVCVGMVPLALVQQHYPRNRRTRLRFADGSFSGANLFLLRNKNALGLVDFWRQMEAHRKSPWRMLRVLGIGSVLRYALGRLALQDVVALLARRTGAQVAPVMLDDPHAAIDVDRVGDLALVREILQLRTMKTAV
ncbi:MAG: NTP transferase domain-containing protein [Alphaproteobacteria bacterium]|nr:NTP transferase domain-containing protein [Alphaproteobacteria bacterium]